MQKFEKHLAFFLKPYFIIFLLGGLGHSLLSYGQQTINNCPSDDLRNQYLLAHPEKAKKEQEELAIYKKKFLELQTNPNNNKSSGLYTLPVVFHIIHSGELIGAYKNPSDEYVSEKISSINQYIRGTQTTSTPTYPDVTNYGVDPEIELCLAQEDPNGNYSSGIVRYYAPDVASVNISTTDFINQNKWDTDRYVNIFMNGTLTTATAYYTGGADVIVTKPGLPALAHEMGHYLSLWHTFTNSCSNSDCFNTGDRVCDTPPQTSATYDNVQNTCSTDSDDTSLNNPFRPISMGGQGDVNDMLGNMMDYGSPGALFTQGQVTKMRNNIEVSRMALLNNNVVCSTSQASVSNDVSVHHVGSQQSTQCTDQSQLGINFTNNGSSILSSVQFEVVYNGTIIATETWTGSLASGASTYFLMNSGNIPVTNASLTIRAKLPNGSTDQNTSNDTANIDLDLLNSPNTACHCDDIIQDTDGDGICDTEDACPGTDNSVLPTLKLQLDWWPDQTVWKIQDGDNVLFSKTYTVDDRAGYFEEKLCVTPGCYDFLIIDTYCSGLGEYVDGFFILEDANGTVLGSGTDFGCTETISFCVEGAPCSGSASNNFASSTLTHSGSGSNSTTLNFESLRTNTEFSISDITEKTKGKASSQYIDEVTVTYVNATGATQTYGTFTGNIDVSINEAIQSVTVELTDGLDGNTGANMSVALGSVTSCGNGDSPTNPEPCAVGTSCNDGDVCTTGDAYDSNCNCVGTFQDSDGDGICDANDTVDPPGGCTNTSFNFSPNPLTKSSGGSSSSTLSFPDSSTDVSFSITNINQRISGKGSRKYIEQVTVTYVDGTGTTQTYGVYSGANTSTVNVNIAGEVQSVTVSLQDIYDGSTQSLMSIDFSSVTACVPGSGNRIDNMPTAVGEMLVLPNPTKDLTQINFYANYNLEAAIQLTAPDGTLVSQKRVMAEQGTNTVTFDLSNLPKGLYFVSVQLRGETTVRKVVKM